MAQEDPQNINEQAPEAGEQGTPDTEAAPVLNRAQRRAQARGKSGASGASGHGAHQDAGGSHGSRTGGHAGPVRFPRTGHK